MSDGTRLAVRLHGVLVPLKYGLAGGLAAAAAARWVPQDVISAAFVALICCRPAVVSALREARDQFVATGLGVGLTVLVMLVAGPGAFAIAFGAAMTWAVASALRWAYPTVVVALFSVVYMGVLAQHDWAAWTLVRAGSLLLGVGAALVVNLLTAPLLGHANFAIRLGTARARVHGLLQALADALRAGDAEALVTARRAFTDLYVSLGEIQAELADLRRDARLARGLVGRPGGRGRDRAARAAHDLELVVHHAQDAADAAHELFGATAEQDRALVAEAGGVLAAAAGALAQAGDGRYDEAVATAEAATRWVRERDAELVPPSDVEHRLGPRLVLLVALAALLDHTARTSVALAGLGEQHLGGEKS